MTGYGGAMTEPLIYTAFHLNLAFSSIEEEDRAIVVENCYRPLLRLAERGIPIGIEATSYTLWAIQDLAPDWIQRLRTLLEEGLVELIGSGYTQMIAPLVPPDVTRWNLQLGLQDYDELLGCRPRIALLNEQAYSPGLVPLYLEAGFEALIMDWSEPASHNADWSRTYSHRPQTLAGSGGSQIPVVWSDAVSFQKFQRYAHSEIEADEYFEFLGLQLTQGAIAFPLYTSDAEVFDFRPGRFATEADRENALTEFERIELLLTSLKKSDAARLGTPSDALLLLDQHAPPIRLETAQAPVPVKKQRKYNLLRWGVSGRNDISLNTACYRYLDKLKQNQFSKPEDWRELCDMWASDFRTHITEDRWSKHLSRFEDAGLDFKGSTGKFEEGKGQTVDVPDEILIHREGRFLIVQTATCHLALNCRRGLAIQSYGPGKYAPPVAGAPGTNGLIGTLAHGFFDDIAFGADFYSGHLVQEPPNSHKVTDLQTIEPSICWLPERRAVQVSCEMMFPQGRVTKIICFETVSGTVDVAYDGLSLDGFEGSCRCGHVTLNPYAFDASSLYFQCSNGGESVQRHVLWDQTLIPVDHGAPVSRLVSATTGLGLTDGVLELGDNDKFIRISMDRTDAAGLGLIKASAAADSFFVRAAITLLETDETSRECTNAVSKLPAPRIRFKLDYGHHPKHL